VRRTSYVLTSGQNARDTPKPLTPLNPLAVYMGDIGFLAEK
jgi:hypothetical protein